jgi:hypothetical protein
VYGPNSCTFRTSQILSLGYEPISFPALENRFERERTAPTSARAMLYLPSFSYQFCTSKKAVDFDQLAPIAELTHEPETGDVFTDCP